VNKKQVTDHFYNTTMTTKNKPITGVGIARCFNVCFDASYRQSSDFEMCCTLSTQKLSLNLTKIENNRQLDLAVECLLDRLVLESLAPPTFSLYIFISIVFVNRNESIRAFCRCKTSYCHEPNRLLLHNNRQQLPIMQQYSPMSPI
jgi:hypothetical protein